MQAGKDAQMKMLTARKAPMQLDSFIERVTNIADQIDLTIQRVNETWGTDAARRHLFDYYSVCTTPTWYENLRPNERKVWETNSQWYRLMRKETAPEVRKILGYLDAGDAETARKYWDLSSKQDTVSAFLREAIDAMKTAQFTPSEFKFGKFHVVDRWGVSKRDLNAWLTALRQVERTLKFKKLDYVVYGTLYIDSDKEKYLAAYIPQSDELEINARHMGHRHAIYARSLIHELAHRLWFKFMDGGARDKWSGRWIEKPGERLPSVTPYGTKDRHEDFAETFTEVVMGKQKDRQLALRLQAVLPKGRVLSNVTAAKAPRFKLGDKVLYGEDVAEIERVGEYDDYALQYRYVIRVGGRRKNALESSLTPIAPDAIEEPKKGQTTTRSRIFKMFEKAVEKAWGRDGAKLVKLVLSSEKPKHKGVLASVTYDPRDIVVIDGKLRRGSSTPYVLRLHDKLLKMPVDKVEKLMLHEALHIGYSKHDARFLRAAKRVGAPLSEMWADDPGWKIQRKEGSRYKTLKTFENKDEARQWGMREMAQKPGKYRIIGSVTKSAVGGQDWFGPNGQRYRIVEDTAKVLRDYPELSKASVTASSKLLYHGTRGPLATAIMKEGLRQHSGFSNFGGGGNWVGVSFTTDLKVARQFGNFIVAVDPKLLERTGYKLEPFQDPSVPDEHEIRVSKGTVTVIPPELFAKVVLVRPARFEVKWWKENRPDVKVEAIGAPEMPFKVGDTVLFGKYKNKRGKIVRFGRNPKGQVTVLIDPIPKGRKKTKEMGLFKIWTTPDAVEAVASKYTVRTVEQLMREGYTEKQAELIHRNVTEKADTDSWTARKVARDDFLRSLYTIGTVAYEGAIPPGALRVYERLSGRDWVRANVTAAFDSAFTVKTVESFRKEFLQLMKNVKRLKSYGDIVKFREACRTWSASLRSYLEIAHNVLMDPVSYAPRREREKIGRNLMANYFLGLMRDIPKPYEPGGSDEFVAETHAINMRKIAEWEKQIRVAARSAWKKLTEAASEWEKLAANYKDTSTKLPIEYGTLERVPIKFIGPVEAEEVGMLRAALRKYRQRAGKTFPWLLRSQLPLVIDQYGRDIDRGAEYNVQHITVFGLLRDPIELVHLLAHEMGHHVYQTLLSHEKRKFWEVAIKGSRGPLDLRDVLKLSSSRYPGTDPAVIAADPLMALRIEALEHDPRYAELKLNNSRRIKEYLDGGGDPILHVTTEPITAYGTKNPEEAFCEALGLLVAYGPRTVLPVVQKRMRILLPDLNVRASVTAATDELYHTTSLKGLAGILRSRTFKARDYDNPFISFSEKPHFGDISGNDAVIVLDGEKLRNRVMPVEYTERWYDRYPEHAAYVAGDGWREQYVEPEDCYDEDGWADEECVERAYRDAELDSFLFKKGEREWVSRAAGDVRLPVDAFKRVVVSKAKYAVVEALVKKLGLRIDVKVLRERVRGAADPFAELSDEAVVDLAAFANKLAWWMGMATPINMKEAVKIWKGNAELRTWLAKHVNRPTTLYRGANVDPANLPEVGTKLAERAVRNWSKDLDRARGFSGIGMTGAKHTAGYIMSAKPALKNIVIDLDAFSALAGRHRDSFVAAMERSGRYHKDAVEMFNGDQYEDEVITTGRITGTVIRAEQWGASAATVQTEVTKAAGDENPEQYRERTGRCPDGFKFDGERCVPSGPKQKRSEPRRFDAPMTTKQAGELEADISEQMGDRPPAGMKVERFVQFDTGTFGVNVTATDEPKRARATRSADGKGGYVFIEVPAGKKLDKLRLRSLVAHELAHAADPELTGKDVDTSKLHDREHAEHPAERKALMAEALVYLEDEKMIENARYLMEHGYAWQKKPLSEEQAVDAMINGIANKRAMEWAGLTDSLRKRAAELLNPKAQATVGTIGDGTVEASGEDAAEDEAVALETPKKYRNRTGRCPPGHRSNEKKTCVDMKERRKKRRWEQQQKAKERRLAGR